MPPVLDVPRDPCYPSPCGPFSQCQNVNGIPSCSCLPAYMGSPPTCRSECTINSDCPSTRACINERCQDPCLGSCGLNAICNVFNHVPSCNCMQSYAGDPFTGCTYQPPSKHSKSKFPFTQLYIILLLHFLSLLKLQAQLNLIHVIHLPVGLIRDVITGNVIVYQNTSAILTQVVDQNVS